MIWLVLSRRRRIVLFACACLLLGAPTAAQQGDASASQGQDGETSARAHYEQGLRHMGDKDYRAALDAFQRSLGADDAPLSAYYARGQAQLALGDVCAAVASYEDYLSRGRRGEIAPETRTRIGRHIDQLRDPEGPFAKCAQAPIPARLTIACADPDVHATLDGRAIEIGQPIPVEAGTHTVTFARAERTWAPLQVELEPGVVSSVVCAELLQSQDKAPSPKDVLPPPRLSAGQKTAWIMMGGGAVVGVSALTLYFYNLSRFHVWKRFQDQLADSDVDPSSETTDELARIARSIDRAEPVNVGLAIAAGALTIGGVTLYLVETNKKKNRSELTVSSGALSAHIQQGTVGLRWSGTW